MRYCFKIALYLFVLFGVSSSFCGSYDDFFAAVQHDDAAQVSSLLQRGFDPNTVDPQGQFGLILALRAQSYKVVDVLLGHPETKVEVRTAQDESPLMLASLAGLVDICEKLIDLDADVNKPGWAPLHYAATGGHLAVIQLLLDNHAYIDAASPNASTPLMMAAMYGSEAAVKLLLDSGADSTLKNSLGLTALEFALTGQRPDAVATIAAAIRASRGKGVW